MGSTEHCRISLLFIVLLRQCCLDPTNYEDCFLLTLALKAVFWSLSKAKLLTLVSISNYKLLEIAVIHFVLSKLILHKMLAPTTKL